MKSTAPSSSPCIEPGGHAPRAANANAKGITSTTLLVALAMLPLPGCQTTKIAVPPSPATPRPAPAPAFACDTTAQEIVCSDAMLAKLDRELKDIHHRNLRHSDSIGRDMLIAGQNRWLIGRAAACQVPTLRLDASPAAPAALTACLIRQYGARIEALKTAQQAAQNVTQTVTATLATAHPLTAYVEFRPAEYAEPQTCAELAEAFNGVLRNRGELDIARIPGLTALAGTHAIAASPPAADFTVDLHDAGPYAGHALRAGTLKDGDGRILLDETSLGNWIRRLPNHGGRPNSAASQTGDYGSIDVFRRAGHAPALVLVAEPWGRYASGAQGEWAYAGVYRLTGSSVAGVAEPLCLYRTYMTPPLKNELQRQPAYNALLELLAQIHGPTSAELVGSDLHEAHLAWQEQQWLTTNMPLLALGEVRRNGWSGWLRTRHDAILDALFAWSERSLRNKTDFRRLLALLPPASEELIDIYRRTQRLSEEDAGDAARLALMRVLAHFAGDLPGHAPDLTAPRPAAGKAPAKHKYPILAGEADLQRERNYTGLYSAAINGAAKEVIDDYLEYESADRKNRLTHGADGETPLMAAVGFPEIVRQLLASGASANETDALGRTPLMNAAAAGQAESARLLINAGAQITARSTPRDTAPGGETACQHIHSALRPDDQTALRAMLCPHIAPP